MIKVVVDPKLQGSKFVYNGKGFDFKDVMSGKHRLLPSSRHHDPLVILKTYTNLTNQSLKIIASRIKELEAGDVWVWFSENGISLKEEELTRYVNDHSRH